MRHTPHVTKMQKFHFVVHRARRRRLNSPSEQVNGGTGLSSTIDQQIVLPSRFAVNILSKIEIARPYRARASQRRAADPTRFPVDDAETMTAGQAVQDILDVLDPGLLS